MGDVPGSTPPDFTQALVAQWVDVSTLARSRTFDEAPPAELPDRGADQDRWHQGLGLGVRVAINDTFIVGLDVGFPVAKAMDGPGPKLYIGLDWLF